MSGPPEGGKWDAIQLADSDNVATVLRGLDAGAVPRVAGGSGSIVRLTETVWRGHKFALKRIAAGETIFKYGAPIGIALRDIEPGAHVHLHNIEGFAGQAARHAGRHP